jgi:hypothetical protein
MSDEQIRTPATEGFTPSTGRLIPRASLVLLLLALPLFLAIDVALTGWIVAAGLWVVGVALHAWVRTTARHATPNGAIGLAAAAMFVRTTIALIALVYVGASVDVGDTTFGLGKPDVAVVAMLLYTLVFTLDMGERIRSDVSARRSISAAREEGA